MSVLNINLNGIGYYTWFKYPKGELQVRFTEEGIETVKRATRINIIADIGSSDDIIQLLLLHNAIVPLTSGELNLILPYLPYGRADRRFMKGDCAGLEVFQMLIYHMHFNKVVTLDAHNAGITCDGPHKNWIDVSPLPLIHNTINNIALSSGKIVVLFPDEGARKRYKLTDLQTNTASVDIITLNCIKHRDAETGKFLGFEVPTKDQFPDNTPVLIIDDICDGGGTFLGIAEALHSYYLDLHLYVTHGIFSQGYDKLTKDFGNIYTSNSITRAPNTHTMVWDCFSLLLPCLK